MANSIRSPEVAPLLAGTMSIGEPFIERGTGAPIGNARPPVFSLASGRPGNSWPAGRAVGSRILYQPCGR